MTFTVYGTPAPQGSKRFVGHSKSGRGIMIESSAAVKPWREAVKYAALAALESRELTVGAHCNGAFVGAIAVRMVFTLPKPKSAKRGAVPSKKPDLSKLIRSTEDALTDAGAWEDDARVVHCFAHKRYSDHFDDRIAVRVGEQLDRPGCVITVEAL